VQPPAQPTDPSGAFLVDAMNRLNELARRAMLWTVRHRWAAGARFAFNCYRNSAQLILRRQDQTGYTLLSREGVTQGDPLSMVLYGLTLVPLAAMINLQRLAAMIDIQHLGPERPQWVYFPEPAKSIFVCNPENWPGAEGRLEAFGFKFVDGSQYVGGFLGSEAALSKWLEAPVAQWVRGVESLAKVAQRYPQTAYAGLAQSLQQEWQYLQHRVLDCGAFGAVEEVIRSVLLLALLQAIEAECQRKLTTVSVRKAGLGLLDPT
jgi:hypothetical protein